MRTVRAAISVCFVRSFGGTDDRPQDQEVIARIMGSCWQRQKLRLSRHSLSPVQEMHEW
jgi:hypothetical protein